MLRIFSEEHLAEMYGAKEDAQDEDFFPYVLVPLTSPQFLQWLMQKNLNSIGFESQLHI